MASYSIIKRNDKYRCQVKWLPPNSDKRRSTSKTFTKKVTAVAWGKKKILECENEVIVGVDTSVPFGQLLDMYLNDPHITIGRSKGYSLRLIRDCDICCVHTSELKAKDIVDFCRGRHDAGAGSATVAADISHLRSVLKSAEALYGIQVDESVIVKAMPTLHTLSLVGKANIRTRRPTENEFTILRAALLQRQSHETSQIPFVDIFDFSILSCMRIGEVCSILWEDVDYDENWVWVRDRKDPRKKVGNHMKVPLLGGAIDIVKRQECSEDPRVFPFNPRSVTAGFQRVRNKLGINDLRYHDLRREGASRLFEKGYKIDEVAQVTGHRDLNTLWRIYTDLNPNRLSD